MIQALGKGIHWGGRLWCP